MTRAATFWLALAVAALQASAAFAVEWQVDILDDEFSPRYLTVAPGDKVTWTNVGGSAHTVTADGGDFDSSTTGNVALPAGAKFSHTFASQGRYLYYCALHGGPNLSGMSGSIRVADASSNHLPATPQNLTPAAGATNQSVSPTLTASAFSDQDALDAHLSSQWLIRELSSVDIFDTGETTQNLTSLKLADLANGQTYAWKVRYRDDLNGWSEYSAETQFTTVAAQSAAGTGLTAAYGAYDLKKALFTVKATQVDPQVNFDWKARKPQAKTPADKFMVRWEGKVLPEFSERYRFLVRADGGVRLWVNDVPLIDDWVLTPFAVYRNRVIALQAGVPAKIKLEYFDGVGNARVDLRWASSSQVPQVIPQAKLYPLTPTP